MTTTPGLIAIIGSGELSDSMAESHRVLMSRLGGASSAHISPVFVDTPAGFEQNIDQIDQKAVSYFRRNFGLELAVARYRHARESAERVGEAIAAIRRANYIFAGPGSPSYALRMWRGSKVWDAILTRWREGAMLVFASAASLVLGEFTIPVYEIYKSGQELNWLEGLNPLAEVGLRMAIIPHWNNHSGDQYDTRYCFMGATRFAELEAMLPSDALALGVDEYTGVTLDVTTRTASVFGVGEATFRHLRHQTVHTKGETVSLNAISRQIDDAPEVQPDALSAEAGAADEVDERTGISPDILALQASVEAAIQNSDTDRVVTGLIALNLIAGAGLEQGVYSRADGAVQAMRHVLPLLSRAFERVAAAAQSAVAGEAERASLLDLLIIARAKLRTAKQFSTADEIRDRLLALGIVLADSPAGTTWQRKTEATR